MSAAEQIPIAPGLFTWPSNDPRLLGSKCGNCGIVIFPAQQSCPACSGQNVEQIELERRGTLWTWTIQGFMPNRPPYTGPETPETFKPFGVGYIELPGQVRVESRLKCKDPSKLEIGMEMELVVEKYVVDDAGREVIAYFFQPVAER
jgi:uncharacterized OB-fold protein